MAKYVLKDPVIVFAGSTITSSCASVTINLSADDVETTAFGSEWRTRIGGLKSGTVDFEMHADFGSGGIDSLFFPNLGGTVAVAVRPAGTAAPSATSSTSANTRAPPEPSSCALAASASASRAPSPSNRKFSF